MQSATFFTYKKKLIINSSEEKIWTELMLWHLNKYRDAEQGLLVFKTVIGNTNGSRIPQFYRDLLKAWADMTGNDLPVPRTLAEIYNEPLFFNRKTEVLRNESIYFNKSPPEWAKIRYKTVGDICYKLAPGFLFPNAIVSTENNTGPKPADLIEMKKLIPKEWREKIVLGTARNEQQNFRIKTYKNKWIECDVETLTCKEFYLTIYQREYMRTQPKRKYYDWHDRQNQLQKN